MRRYIDIVNESQRDIMLYHATLRANLASIERDGVKPTSYWASTEELVEYYSEDGDYVVISAPLSAFDPTLLRPDYPGINEPITTAIGKSEAAVIAEWKACDGTWQDSLRIIHSVSYEGVIHPTEIDDTEPEPVAKPRAPEAVAKTYRRILRLISWGKAEADDLELKAVIERRYNVANITI